MSEMLELNLIDPSPNLIREIDWLYTVNELAKSIEKYGVLQPILVRPTSNKRYEIVFGNHRYYAADRIGLEKIPANIKDISDLDALILSLIENIQRLDLNPVREGEVYVKLLSEYDIKELSDIIGKSIQYIKGRINVYENLHPDLINEIGNTLTVTNAKHLSRLGKSKQLEVFKQIEDTKNGLTKPHKMGLGLIGGGFTPSDRFCICPKCGTKHLRSKTK